MMRPSLILCGQLLVLALASHGAAQYSFGEDELTGSAPRLRHVLLTRIDLNFDRIPLSTALMNITRLYDVRIVADQEMTITPEMFATCAAKRLPLGQVLRQLLGAHNLRYVTIGNALLITPGASPSVAIGKEDLAPVFRHKGDVALRCARQLRPIFRMQLQFVERVCRPTTDEMAFIREEAEQALQDAAFTLARRQASLGGNGRQIIRLSAEFDPRQRIRDGVADAVGSCLSRPQAQRFAAEVAAFDAHARHAVQEMIVLSIHDRLELSDDQQHKLRDTIAANCTQDWYPSLEGILEFPNAPFPVPRQLLFPLLTQQQIATWNNTRLADPSATLTGFGVDGTDLRDPAAEDGNKEHDAR